MLNRNNRDQVSKFMSLILRHKPQKFGIVLDGDGFCKLDDLLCVFHKEEKWKTVTLDDILQIVKECPKQRYEIEDEKIRARYGHSTQKLAYKEGTPPAILYHGTNEKAFPVIMNSGLKKMGREYIHLSETTHFATLSGQRRGSLVILEVDTKKALENGVKFYYAGNEVWLCDFIPQSFLKRV